MNTVDRALTLLRHFSVESPELGLSEMSRRAGLDKTTTLRCLTALCRNGFVEQDSDNRKYRLGLAPINLARIREQSFPVQTVIDRHLQDLTAELEETSHSTLLMGDDLFTTGRQEPDRALFVHVDPSGALPWHATASGMAVAAFQPPEIQEALLNRPDRQNYTPHTLDDQAALRAQLDQTRASGISRALSTYEDGVIGSAAPFFGQAGTPIGAIAVAAVAMRFTPELNARIDAHLRQAARAITRELGGLMPPGCP